MLTSARSASRSAERPACARRGDSRQRSTIRSVRLARAQNAQRLAGAIRIRSAHGASATKRIYRGILHSELARCQPRRDHAFRTSSSRFPSRSSSGHISDIPRRSGSPRDSARSAPYCGRPGTSGRSISIAIPAYNEGVRIRGTIESLLALDYPADRRQIVIVSDGSTDDTDSIVAEYAERGVELHRVATRRRKDGRRKFGRATFCAARSSSTPTPRSAFSRTR